jgi:addiction module RelE/StbE family toxin
VTPHRPELPRTELEIVWSRKALRRLQEIRQYVAQDKPEAAARLATRIVSVVSGLRVHPYMGRASAEPGIRELVIGVTPYIVMYKTDSKRVTILTIWHGKQERK